MSAPTPTASISWSSAPGQLVGHGITELHIVGGMTKEYDLPYYEELFCRAEGGVSRTLR